MTIKSFDLLLIIFILSMDYGLFLSGCFIIFIQKEIKTKNVIK